MHDLSIASFPPKAAAHAEYSQWRRQRLAERLAAPPADAAVRNHLITLVLFTTRSNEATDLAVSIASLREQLYRNIELLVLGQDSLQLDTNDFYGFRGLAADPRLTPEVLLAEEACDTLWRGDYLTFAQAGAEFDADAFALLNAALVPKHGRSRPDLVLCDHDRRLSPGDYARPSFLPGWDPDLIQSYDYVSTAFMASRNLVHSQRAAGRAESLHEWLRRLGRGQPEPVTAHVAETAMHLAGPLPPPPAPFVPSASQARLPDAAIIIPNRNKPEMLARCLGFLDFANRFRPEIVVVDNASDDPALPGLYAELRERHGIQVLHMDQPFNFSRMVNLGVAATRAELVVLLNNDVRFSAPGQIERLLAAAMRPEVGVVGCRLLYPDGTTQHAGMLLRSEAVGTTPIRAAHLLRGAPPDEAGYLHQLETTRNWQAVTGAVMAMRREVFDRVGGFDEIALPVEYNDVDFCLRAREAGLRVISLPLDGVFHDESATRGRAATPQSRMMHAAANALMAKRWANAFYRDPFRNPWVMMEEIPEAQFPWSVRSAAGDQPSSALVQKAMSTSANPHRNLPHGKSQAARRRAKRTLRKIFQKGNLGVRLHGLLGRIVSDDGLLQPPAAAASHADLHNRDDSPRRLRDGLSVVGYFCSEIGLGEAARNFAYACDSQRLPVSLRHLHLAGRENETEFVSKCNRVDDRKGNLLIVGLPAIVDLPQEIVPGRTNILFPFWELSRIPKPWFRVARGFDEIWAPSRFVCEAFPPNFGRPVRLVPQPVRLPAKDPPVRQGRDAFRVLTYFDFDSWGTRKNPTGAIAAFQAAFPPAKQDVALIIKVRGRRDAGLRAVLARAAAADSRIQVIDRTVDRTAMDALIATCDAFLSLHRSEGFGFGAAESLAAARAVVATNYGGTCDFITEETGYPVPYVLAPVQPDDYVGGTGQVWAIADEEAAVTALRAIYDDPAEADARARCGLALLRQRHAPAVVGAMVAGRLRELGLLRR